MTNVPALAQLKADAERTCRVVNGDHRKMQFYKDDVFCVVDEHNGNQVMVSYEAAMLGYFAQMLRNVHRKGQFAK